MAATCRQLWVVAVVAAAAWTTCASAAATPVTDSIIFKLSGDDFSVQSEEPAPGELIGPNLRRISVPQGGSLQAQLELVRALKGVEYAVPDLPIYPQGHKAGRGKSGGQRLPGNQKSFSKQWGAVRVGLPAAWSIAVGAPSKASAVNVCIVDSGVDSKHPDLAANLVPGIGVNAINGEDSSNPRDILGHGTAMAGIIAGTGEKGGIVGVNWNNINVLSCKFMSAAGWGRTSDAIQCIDYCLDKGAAIISASWSCGVSTNPPLKEAVERASEAGALLVVAAGNLGVDMAKTPFYPQAYAKDFDNVLVVGATTEYDEHAPFSNWGKDIVHLSAPGNWIYTTAPGGNYNYTSGTSIAAPFVTGSAALLLAVAQDRLGTTLTAAELKQRLMDSAEALPGLAARTASAGRLRTDWALQKLLGLKLSPPMPRFARPGVQSASMGKGPVATAATPPSTPAHQQHSNHKPVAAASPAPAPQEGTPEQASDTQAEPKVCGEMEPDIVFSGGDIEGVWRASNATQCASFCADEPECRAWTHVPEWGRCYLKRSTGWHRKGKAGAASMALMPCGGAVKPDSGLGPGIMPVGDVCGKMEQDTSFYGGDIEGIWRTNTVEDCAAMCWDNLNCRAFTFISAWNGCYLKYGGGWARKAKAGVVSVTLRPCDTDDMVEAASTRRRRSSSRRSLQALQA